MEAVTKAWSKAKWRLAELLDSKTDRCWADLCMWAIAEHRSPREVWRQLVEMGREPACVEDSRGGFCYCGKFVNGRCKPIFKET